MAPFSPGCRGYAEEKYMSTPLLLPRLFLLCVALSDTLHYGSFILPAWNQLTKMASGLGNYMMKSVGPSRTGTASPATQLYRAIAKEVPRILTIYDVDMDFAQARAAIALYFRNNGHLKDPRVVDALVMKGYMDLEETTMQYKQKTHLLRLLNPSAHNDARAVKDDFMGKFMAGTS